MRFIPVPQFIVELPEWPADLAKRHHNQFVKESLAKTIEWHFKENIPRHFKPGNEGRYNHAKRAKGYLEQKRRRRNETTDLVYSGKSRRAMRTNYKLRMGGTAAANTIKATIISKFHFKGGSGRSRHKGSNVTIAQMCREVERWHESEIVKANDYFHGSYMVKLALHMRNRKRKRVIKRR